MVDTEEVKRLLREAQIILQGATKWIDPHLCQGKIGNAHKKIGEARVLLEEGEARITGWQFQQATYAIYKYLTDDAWAAATVGDYLGFDDVAWVVEELLPIATAGTSMPIVAKEPGWMCIQCCSDQPDTNDSCSKCGQKHPKHLQGSD